MGGALPELPRAWLSIELPGTARDVAMPGAFAVFAGSRDAQSRVRACTACCLDLAERDKRPLIPEELSYAGRNARRHDAE